MKRVMMILSTVALSLFIVGTAFSQSNIGIMGVGGKLGIVDVTEKGAGSTIGFGAVADLGTIVPNLMLEGNLEYWSDSENQGGVDASFRDFIIGGAAKYLIKSSNPNFTPFVGGGLGLHLQKAENELLGQKNSNSETDIGIHLLGGVFYAASPTIDILGELRYAVVSDLNQISIMGGAIFKLKK
jgi:opacity protein-like surface antigen